MRRLCAVRKSSPCSLQLEKACTQQQNNPVQPKINKNFKKNKDELDVSDMLRDYYKNLGGFLILPMTLSYYCPLRLGHDLVIEQQKRETNLEIIAIHLEVYISK